MSGAAGHEALARQLATGLRPVRRLRPPFVRALSWLGCVGVLAALLASVSPVDAVRHRLVSEPDLWLALVGAGLTAVLAAFAAFQLSLPDRKPGWALLPLPAVALWLGASGLGCLRVAPAAGMHPATLHDTRTCLTFILSVSVPLSALLLLMLRRAAPLWPGLTAGMAGLAAAGAAAALLVFVHPFDASIIDLVVHAVAVGLVVLVARLVGRGVLPQI